MIPPDNRIPATIITGFLGSGKVCSFCIQFGFIYAFFPLIQVASVIVYCFFFCLKNNLVISSRGMGKLEMGGWGI